MRLFKGLLSIALLFMAYTTTGERSALRIAPSYTESRVSRSVGYTVHNGEIYEVIETVKKTYHLRK